ncbi:MAG: bifunctional oligoribonuclease/PAP phosphatase NrnA [Schleiferiaceae bacterium]|nr:bifunctional oligoribonuclease/PAP phosphatase NrnA [Schleiferiaceae bacterium]
MIDSNALEKLKALLATPKKIVVTNHINPDGDAMGSALGWAGILTALGHHVEVIVPNEFPPFLNALPHASEVLIAEADFPKAKKAFNQAEVIFSLDYNAPNRAGVLEDLLLEATGTKVLIDHHQEPTGFSDIDFWDPTCCSTAQLVFELIEALGYTHLVNPGIARQIYTGILTDTGSFRFKTTTAKTHQIVAQLIAAGVNPDEVYNSIFNQNTPARFKLLGVMLNRMEILPQVNAALLYLTKEELQEAGYKKGDTEGFVNYGLSVLGIKVSAFFVERDNLIKASFRSIDDVNVNTFARTYFNGGGHINAAGGSSKDTMDVTLQKFKEAIHAFSAQ